MSEVMLFCTCDKGRLSTPCAKHPLNPMTTQADREERERIVWNEAIEAARYAAASTNADLYKSGAEAYITMLAAIRQLKRDEHRKDGHD